MPEWTLDFLRGLGGLDPFIGPFGAVLLIQMVVIKFTGDKVTRRWAMRGAFALDAIIIFAWVAVQLKGQL